MAGFFYLIASTDSATINISQNQGGDVPLMFLYCR